MHQRLLGVKPADEDSVAQTHQIGEGQVAEVVLGLMEELDDLCFRPAEADVVETAAMLADDDLC